MSGILISSFLLVVLILIAFVYLIYTILRQKTVEELKTDFTNNMTHELKTPISVAYAANDVFLNYDTHVSEKQKKYLSIVREQLTQLTGLVEQFLTLSVENRNTFRLKQESILISDLIAPLIEQHKLKAGKPVNITTNIPEAIAVFADRTHFYNILGNLIDNAVKYSGDNPAEIFISAETQSNEIRVSVTDNGVGISEVNQQQIFDKFYRVPSGNLHSVKRVWAGIILCKRYNVETWRIGHRKKPTGQRNHIHPAFQKLKEKTMAKIKVLLVEDEPTLAMIIKDTLDGEEFDIVLAANGEEGLALYKEIKPDIIVTDIMMPKIDGFTLIRHIRKTDSQIPVLFLSARSAANDVVEGFELGGNDYLKKPFGMAELIVRIKALLNKITVRKEEKSTFTLGQYTFDAITQTLLYCGEKQLQSNRESEILKRLCENKDHVLPMKDVLLDLCGDDSFFNARSLHVFITKLRHKLSKDESIKILNVRGIGYKLIID